MDSNFGPNFKKVIQGSVDRQIGPNFEIGIDGPPSTDNSESDGIYPISIRQDLSKAQKSIYNIPTKSYHTVFRNWNLTGAFDRGPRDLVRLVLWRYTSVVIIWVFMISLKWSNRHLFQMRNHKLSWKKSYIVKIFSIFFVCKNLFKAIYGFWFEINANLTILVKSWKPIS